VYTFIIIFIAAYLVFYAAMAFIFYKAMKANQKDEKKVNYKIQSPHPNASRPAPRMEQRSALEAGVYHVLPVQEE
jgi:hypothetical protein